MRQLYPRLCVAANTDIGLLYGSFAWLRQCQLGASATRLEFPETF